MTVKFGNEQSFGKYGQMGKLDPFHKGFFGVPPADTWTPNVNLYESDSCYMVCVDLAGVEKDNIDVVVHNQRMRLTGRREVPARQASDECNERIRIHLMEIDHGNFSREVELPADVDQDKIVAAFENGLLWIELPKK